MYLRSGSHHLFWPTDRQRCNSVRTHGFGTEQWLTLMKHNPDPKLKLLPKMFTTPPKAEIHTSRSYKTLMQYPDQLLVTLNFYKFIPHDFEWCSLWCGCICLNWCHVWKLRPWNVEIQLRHVEIQEPVLFLMNQCVQELRKNVCPAVDNRSINKIIRSDPTASGKERVVTCACMHGMLSVLKLTIKHVTCFEGL